MFDFHAKNGAKQRIKALLEDSTTRNYLVLLCSQGFNFAAAFLNNILLTRFMSEPDFGSYKYGHNFLNLITTIALFGMPYSASRLLARNTSKRREREIIGTMLKNMTLVSILCSLILFFFCVSLSLIGLPINHTIYACLPVIVLIVLQQSHLTMLQGTGKVSGISIQTFLPSGTMLAVLFIAFIGGVEQLSFFQVWGIFCIGYALAQLLTFGITRPILAGKHPEIQQEFLHEQQVSGKNVYIGSLMGVASSYCVNFVLGNVSEMSEYAVYALAWSLASALQMIPSVMGTVMFRKNAQTTRIPRKDVIFTFSVSACAYLCFVFMLHIMIPILFPASYTSAKWMGAVLGFAMILNGTGDFFNRFISANGYGKYIQNGAMLTGITNISGAVLLLNTWKIHGVITARVLASTIYLAAMIFYYHKVVKEKERMIPDETES